jgi:5-hydroxyisourate hydrolase-like protein (transthyretin family)
MKTIITVICLLGGIYISSCKKTVFNRAAKGHIVDFTTGKGIAGAKVFLKRSKGQTLDPTNAVEQDTIYTGSDGNFDFHYKKYNNWSYEICASKEDYFFDPNLDYKTVEKDNNRSLELKLFPKAILNFDIKNSKGGDFLNFGILVGRCSREEILGQGVFKTIPFEVIGNTITPFSYYIVDRNGQESIVDTVIYCPAFQTTTFTIEY